MRNSHRHRIEAIAHQNGLTISGGRDRRILIDFESSLDSAGEPKTQTSFIETPSGINSLQIWQNIIAAGCQDGAILLYNATTKSQLDRFTFFDERPVSPF